jgi:hypothetical protein
LCMSDRATHQQQHTEHNVIVHTHDILQPPEIIELYFNLQLKKYTI